MQCYVLEADAAAEAATEPAEAADEEAFLAFLDYELQPRLGISDDIYRVDVTVLRCSRPSRPHTSHNSSDFS